MHKTRELTILMVLAMVTPGNTKILNPAIVKPEHVNSLQSLTHEQALPFVFFEEGEEGPLQLPIGLTEIEIVNGRLASGTEFYTIPPKDQTFFCPDQDSAEECLIPKSFGESQVLQCEREPTYSIFPYAKYKKCGPGGFGTSMAFLYRICPSQLPYTYSSRSFHIYKFCLDEASERNLFVQYETNSAKLLSERILKKEREITFEEGLTDHSETEPKPDYELQKLLPPEIMPFAWWKKTTYHEVNMAWQHKKLINLWNEINDHIITNAIETFQLPRTIITGIIDKPQNELPISGDKNQMYNIWITLILDKNLKTHKGLAVMMHNFITTHKNDNLSKEKSNMQLFIDKISERDLCVETLKREFENVGGQVRCCPVTETVKAYFYSEEMDTATIARILEIRNITNDAEGREKLKLN